MRPIFLIGFMCSGKTTLGRAVCERTGLRFIDLDYEIEQHAGMSVKDIFATKGESAFRELERTMLAEVSALEDVVVACGGGTPCQPGAMDLMNDSGITIRLVPSEKRMLHRLMAGRHKRPLIASISSQAEMRDFLIFTSAKREEYYCKARHRFDTTCLDNQDEVANTVEKFIAAYITPTNS